MRPNCALIVIEAYTAALRLEQLPVTYAVFTPTHLPFPGTAAAADGRNTGFKWRYGL
jgi:hypothetical protein